VRQINQVLTVADEAAVFIGSYLGRTVAYN